MKDKTKKQLFLIITILMIIFLVVGIVSLSFAITGKIKGNKLMTFISVSVMAGAVVIEVILGCFCSNKFFDKRKNKEDNESLKKYVETFEERRKLYSDEELEGEKDDTKNL